MSDKVPDCCGEVVKSQALGKEYYYCRGCKSEVSESSGKGSRYDSVSPLRGGLSSILDGMLGYYAGSVWGSANRAAPATAPALHNWIATSFGWECTACHVNGGWKAAALSAGHCLAAQPKGAPLTTPPPPCPHHHQVSYGPGYNMKCATCGVQIDLTTGKAVVQPGDGGSNQAPPAP